MRSGDFGMALHRFTGPPTGLRTAFTLLELVVVMTIIGVVGAIAVPRYTTFVGGQRADAAARRITTDLSYLQRRARTYSQSLTVSFDVGTDSYSVPGMRDPDHTDRDYVVLLSREPYEATIESADFGGDTDLVFDGYGILDSGGTVIIRVGKHQRTITVEAGSSVTPDLPIEKLVVAE